MFAIRLEKELERDLDMLAKNRGTNRSVLVREAIVRYLEDNEDLEMARQSQSDMRSSKTLSQLRDELGLDR